MDIKQIKKDARKSFKRNFFITLLVVFIAGIIINGGYSYTTYIFSNPNNYVKEIEKRTNYSAINRFVKNIIDDGTETKRGVIAPLVNNMTESNSITVGFIETLDNIIFSDHLSKQIISVSAFAVSILFYIFVQNVFKVNRSRYLLEQRRYKNTKIDKLLFSYQIKKTLHLSYILFIRTLCQLLWSLTIVGGVIKFYEYRLIPYILAENPNLTSKETFALSKELSNSYKFEMFKLDVSLIGWYILQILTLGLSNILYFDAYRECIYAEMYINIRRDKKTNIPNGDLLNDNYLDIDEYQYTSYPKDKFSIQLSERKHIFDVDFRNPYSITDYILIFFTLIIVGWVWEVFYNFIQFGAFVNRGTMHGPWIPIYGAGGLLTLIGLKRFRKKPFLFFILSMVVCGIIEYFTAVWLEVYKGMSWWSYEGYFLNIQGRICFEGLLVFGLGCTAVTYLIAPILNNIYSKLPKKLTVILCAILLFLFGVDFAYTQYYPNTGSGVTTGIPNN